MLGSDPVTDVAVLRIDAKGLPTVRLGDPKQLEVGDPVLAIGAPFGFEQTATQGIVSAKGRSLPGDAVVPFIQTDAAVNPGNSGGPLFDGNGAVVGINAQIYSHTGGYQGLAFAIPIDVALKVKDQIVATGKASHARLGVTVQDLNQPLAESFGLKRPDGALVAQVAPGSAAAAAGLKAGDVITHVNGEALPRSGALSSVIGMSAPGEKVKLERLARPEGRRHRGQAGRRDAGRRGRGRCRRRRRAGRQLGLALRPLQPQRAAAGQARRRPGGRAGGGRGANAPASKPATCCWPSTASRCSSIEQIRGVLKSQPKSVALLVQRQGNQIFVPVPLG